MYRPSCCTIRSSDMSLGVLVASAKLGCITWYEENVHACRPQVPQVSSKPMCIWHRSPQGPQCFHQLVKGVCKRISYSSLLTSAILLLRQPPLAVRMSTSRQHGPQVRHLTHVSTQTLSETHGMRWRTKHCADHARNDT